MRADADKLRKFKLEKEKEVCKLKQQDQKRQVEIIRKQQQFEKQQNVLKRKMEEAVAANKRLKVWLKTTVFPDLSVAILAIYKSLFAGRSASAAFEYWQAE